MKIKKPLKIQNLIVFFLIVTAAAFLFSIIIALMWGVFQIAKNPEIKTDLIFNSLMYNKKFFLTIILSSQGIFFISSNIIRKKYFHGMRLVKQNWNMITGVLVIILTLFASTLLGLINSGVNTLFNNVSNQAFDGFIYIEKNNILLILFMAVLPAINEEYLFRKIILSSLSNRYSIHIANIITSFLFALFHYSIFTFIYMFLLSFLFGYIYQKTLNIFYPMLMHFINNLYSVYAKKMIIDSQKNVQPSKYDIDIPAIVIVFVCFIAVIYLILFIHKSLDKDFKIKTLFTKSISNK